MLARGGLLVFQEIPISWKITKPSLLEKAFMSLEQRTNNEPHFIDCAMRDAGAIAKAMGYSEVVEQVALSPTSPPWQVVPSRGEKVTEKSERKISIGRQQHGTKHPSDVLRNPIKDS